MYSVQQLSRLAGVSIKTLHLYDRMGLLKPASRKESKYRVYGEAELLRLQQILFYKALAFPLKVIKDILDDPDFDLLHSLQHQQQLLLQRQEETNVLLATLEKTISSFTQHQPMEPQDLYEGLPKEQAEAYRKEAVAQYGSEVVEHAEKSLRKLSKEEVQHLKAESEDIRQRLFAVMDKDPHSQDVQALIALHYANVRSFWGTSELKDKQAETYKGLGQLYIHDERFTQVNGESQPLFAAFLQKAMAHFADTVLKE